jgi:hypothetical protein
MFIKRLDVDIKDMIPAAAAAAATHVPTGVPAAGASSVGMSLHGARFSAEIYTRGCHWIPRMFA